MNKKVFPILLAVFILCVSALSAHAVSYSKPKILPRSTWLDSSLSKLVNWLPMEDQYPSDWQKPEIIVIHHTAGNNNSIDSISKIKSIFRFHAVSRGWGDIGYNYLIDKQGNIYEGRIGGNGVRGAHVFVYPPNRDFSLCNEVFCRNYNYKSIGIAVLGNYSQKDTNTKTYKALASLVGWLGAANDFNPSGTISNLKIWNKGTEKFSSMYNGLRVVGHGDLGTTSCPGKISVSKVARDSSKYYLSFKDKYKTDLKKFAQNDKFIKKKFIKTKKYKDNSLVREINSPNVYLIQNNKKRRVLSAQVFEKNKFNWGNIIIANPGDLSAYENDKMILYPDNTLLKTVNSPRIYLTKHGIRHWITSASMFESLNYKWKNIIETSAQEVSHYVLGTLLGSSDNENAEDIVESEGSDNGKKLKDPKFVLKEPLIKIGIYELNNKKLETKQLNDQVVEILFYENRPAWKPVLNDNLFHGKVYKEQSWAINELKLEDYVKGVAEALNNDEPEHLRAMAVIARTYAYYYIEKQGKHANMPFYLKNTSGDQLYKGFGFESRAGNWVSAVNETKGEVLQFNNKTALPAYSSDTGGVSLSACKVWGRGEVKDFCANDFSYLKGGVADPVNTLHEYKPSDCGKSGLHCVGLSAAGSRQMAKNGENYEQILTKYFPGVRIEQVYE